jgi:hypothetical protein
MKQHDALDCRSEEGVTVGLIDALITLARVLTDRDFTPPAVVEALKDLADDEDIQKIMNLAKRSASDGLLISSELQKLRYDYWGKLVRPEDE